MKQITHSFWGIFGTLTLLFFLAAGLPDLSALGAIRDWVLQYSGILAMAAMSLALVLATRPRWLEPWLGGLDKSYRLHKWLGIGAFVAGLIHWLVVDLDELGPEGREDRVFPGAQGRPTPTGIEGLFNQLRDAAETAGEPALYGAGILIIVALVRLVPYRFFAKTHKFIALAYLLLVFHAVILMEFAFWQSPLGLVMAAFYIAGSVSALMVLKGRVGQRARARGEITELVHAPNTQTLRTSLTVDDGWKGHAPGQFAFVTFDASEGAHPFTIASAWDAETREMSFVTKALGDYTARMPSELRVGQEVALEGPYGTFTFDSPRNRQIWIGGGIGITPFLARMSHLATAPTNMAIDLFHTARELDQDSAEALREMARAAGVRLHLMRDTRDGRLDGARLREMVPDWAEASVWFCGPAPFGEALERDMVAAGLARSDFHRELFQMR